MVVFADFGDADAGEDLDAGLGNGRDPDAAREESLNDPHARFARGAYVVDDEQAGGGGGQNRGLHAEVKGGSGNVPALKIYDFGIAEEFMAEEGEVVFGGSYGHELV